MIIGACLIMRVGYGIPIPQTVVALLMSALLSVLAVQAAGVTGDFKLPQSNSSSLTFIFLDITPITAVSKASQIALAGMTQGQGWTLRQAQTMNLLGGSLAAIGAGQAAGAAISVCVFLPKSDLTLPRSHWRLPRRLSPPHAPAPAVLRASHRHPLRVLHRTQRLPPLRHGLPMHQRRRRLRRPRLPLPGSQRAGLAGRGRRHDGARAARPRVEPALRPRVRRPWRRARCGAARALARALGVGAGLSAEHDGGGHGVRDPRACVQHRDDGRRDCSVGVGTQGRGELAGVRPRRGGGTGGWRGDWGSRKCGPGRGRDFWGGIRDVGRLSSGEMLV